MTMTCVTRRRHASRESCVVALLALLLFAPTGDCGTVIFDPPVQTIRRGTAETVQWLVTLDPTFPEFDIAILLMGSDTLSFASFTFDQEWLIAFELLDGPLIFDDFDPNLYQHAAYVGGLTLGSYVAKRVTVGVLVANILELDDGDHVVTVDTEYDGVISGVANRGLIEPIFGQARVIIETPCPSDDECADDYPCTADHCDPVLDCVNELSPGFCLIAGTCYDDGELNPTNDCQVCTSSLSPSQWVQRPSGAPCGSGAESLCNHADTCDGTDVCRPNLEVDGTSCSNGIFCDGQESCWTGVCQPGALPACDDGVLCTVDACDVAIDECRSVPNHQLCDDGQFCNGAERCDGVLGCVAADLACPNTQCDEESDQCLAAPIPTVSEWGVTILCLLMLTGSKVLFGGLMRQRSPRYTKV